MNKFILYGLLLLIYLGLSKTFSPSEYGISYINSDDSLSALIAGVPVSVLLVDIHHTGFLIKTYYHKYKVIYGYQSYEELIVRTSKIYSDQKKPYLGMAVFRRDRDGIENHTPLPPGSVFIGDKNLGKWITHPSGEKRWRFFGVYRNLVHFLGWQGFEPSLQLRNKIQIFLEQEKPFFGENKEFGLTGTITQTSFPAFFNRSNQSKISSENYFERYLKQTFTESDHE